MEDFFNQADFDLDRRSLPRVSPAATIWAAVENTTRREMLGMSEVADFSGLGLCLRGIAGDPVVELGDRLWVTLVAEEGLIPLRATLVHIKREGHFGLKVEAPSEYGEHFLLRLYSRAASSVSAESPSY